MSGLECEATGKLVNSCSIGFFCLTLITGVLMLARKDDGGRSVHVENSYVAIPTH